MSGYKKSGAINNDVYDQDTIEYTETGKLDFDFLLGRHILHVNNLLSQDILGDTVSGKNLGIQRCEVALDVLSNMIEIYTKTLDVSTISDIVLSEVQLIKSGLDKSDDDKLTYYAVYKELRTEQYTRYKNNIKNKNLSPEQKQIKLIEFRYSQLSIIHRYLMLWVDECGLTPRTTSMEAIIR